MFQERWQCFKEDDNVSRKMKMFQEMWQCYKKDGNVSGKMTNVSGKMAMFQ